MTIPKSIESQNTLLSKDYLFYESTFGVCKKDFHQKFEDIPKDIFNFKLNAQLEAEDDKNIRNDDSEDEE
jgi:hypothetical protein